MTDLHHRLLDRLGLLLGAAALLGVLWLALRGGLPPALAATPGTALAELAEATALLAVAAVLAGGAFVVLLRLTVRPTMRRSCLFGIFLLTQLDRYRPVAGAHYAARHAALAPFGVTRGESATAAMAEALCLLTAVGLLVAVAAAAGRIDWSLGLRVASEFALLTTGLAGAALLVMVVLQRSVVARLFASRRAVVRMLVAVGHYAAMLVLTGAALQGLTALVAPAAPQDLLAMSTMVAAAWLAGLVMPGTPAGLGVRDVVLTALLAPTTGLDAAAAATIGLRLAGLLADALAAGAGLVMVALAHPKPSVGVDVR
ncbi:hypothetical protein RHODGE_RHODGE_04073 [Rhodoplanes serenus]|uniref:Lysylphosphatidylglycerol synthetase family protein n=1 Tax=Rhodoplanes serenus TaxID=200615 RepID=A0A3S4FBM8_9BRAD|nr:hypothetical protein [Rhodoplanes serenus]VCU10475.1 hypothetical protein RHODGE_RHODGE_04073 [Rhodoplanes serenus]